MTSTVPLEPRYLQVSHATMGICSHSSGEHGIGFSMAVLPKAWRPRSVARNRTIQWSGEESHLEVSCFEGDTIKVEFMPYDSKSKQKDELLLDLLSKIKREAQETDGIQTDSTEEDLENKTTPLISFGKQFHLAEVADSSLDSRLDSDAEMLDGLFHILVRFGDREHSNTLENFASSPFFQPLLHRQFVDEVESNLKHIRLGYVQKREQLTMIRGRLVETSILPHSIQVECIFDEFSQETPLLMLIATALDLVAMKWGVGSTPLFEEVSKTNQHSAQSLRKYMHSVPSASPIAIHQRMKSVVLPRSDQPWKRAVKLALDIIEQKGTNLKMHDGKTDTMIYEKSSSHIWEKLVAAPLEYLGHDVSTEGRTPSAWVGLGNKRRLDLVVDQRIIIDGKYKSPPRKLSAITMADRDQMFAYSYLQTAKPEKIVLAYPKYELDEERPHDVSLVGKPAQRGGSDGNCELIAVLIPFPTPATLSALHQWNKWKASVGADLQEHIMYQPLQEA